MRLLPFEYAVRNLGRSRLRLFASVAGAALVAGLVLAAGGFIRGMERSLSISGNHRNVILLGAGSEESVERSQISMRTTTLLAASVPGIRRRLGVDYISPEVHFAVPIKLSADDPREFQAVARGVTPSAFLVHPQVRIVDGRAPRPGHDEVMVGALAATRLGARDADLAIGRSVWFDNHAWTISGRFEAPHTVMNAEVWVPLGDLQIATKRNDLSCVIATLDEATFEDVDLFCKQRLDLELIAIPESEYYASLLKFFRPVRVMIWVTAILIALGGIFGGLNTMYAAFASRVRELGALQTLGFGRGALALSFLQESMLATVAGGLGATVLAMLLLDGVAVRFSLGAFELVIDATVVISSFAAVAALAVVGILPPLWRCLRLSIVEALRTG